MAWHDNWGHPVARVRDQEDQVWLTLRSAQGALEGGYPVFWEVSPSENGFGIDIFFDPISSACIWRVSLNSKSPLPADGMIL